MLSTTKSSVRDCLGHVDFDPSAKLFSRRIVDGKLDPLSRCRSQRTALAHHIEMHFNRLGNHLSGVLDGRTGGDTAGKVWNINAVSGRRSADDYEVAHGIHGITIWACRNMDATVLG